MVAMMTESYDVQVMVVGEGRKGVRETHLFDVLNRVKPRKRLLTRLFIVSSRFLTMVNDKNATCHKNSEFESGT